MDMSGNAQVTVLGVHIDLETAMLENSVCVCVCGERFIDPQ